MKKTLSKKNFQSNELQKKRLKLFSPETKPKTQIKKIFLNCFSFKEKNDSNQIKNNNEQTQKHKSFSLNKLYRYSIKKNSNNLYFKLGVKILENKNKIVINCLDGNKHSKITNSVENKKISKNKILSNGSTRKSSDESQVEIHSKREPLNYTTNYRNPHQNWKSLKINCITLKKKNNGIKIDSIQNELKNVQNIKVKSKEKDNIIKKKESSDVEQPSIPAQMNYFLNNNKINNTTSKKETLYNSVCQKKIEPLKLFDYDASSSSSSVEGEEGKEENESIHEEIKIADNNNTKIETEYEIDSKFKISEGEISDELNESHKEKKNKNNNIFEKKSISKDSNEEELDCHNNNNLSKQPEKSCKNMSTRFFLSPNQNETSNKNIIISSILTKPGISDNKEKINQDSYLIIENLFSQNFNIYGIFDGHGDNGHLISNHISNFMNDYYNNKLNYYLNENDKKKLFIEKISNIFLGNHNKIIKNCSLLLDQEINRINNYDISQSGSTSLMLFIVDDTLICSNVGDSQCYLFDCSLEDLWTFELLSKQHLASDEKEQKRIIESGGEIHPYYEEDGVYEGPDRIYAKNQIYPGLAMSRTIGDLEAKKIGVISEPDIIIKKIENTSKFLIAGSDGLWDVVKPYDIIRMIRPYFNKGDIEGACQILMKKAMQQWIKNNEERDDITIIVIFIGAPNNCLVNEKNNVLNKIEETEDDKECSSKKLLSEVEQNKLRI